MTKEDAKREQEELGKYFNLAWWFGTGCEKCCEVYPKLIHSGDLAGGMCAYECPVCGKRTDWSAMPWIAEAAWNANKVSETSQLSIF